MCTVDLFLSTSCYLLKHCFQILLEFENMLNPHDPKGGKLLFICFHVFAEIMFFVTLFPVTKDKKNHFICQMQNFVLYQNWQFANTVTKTVSIILI